MKYGYEFHCSAPDCAEHSHEEGDFSKCDSCNALMCLEHAHKPVNYTAARYCAECFWCAVCQAPALAQCEECGELRCAEHSDKTSEQVDEWNQGDAHYFCEGACRRAAVRKPAGRAGLWDALAKEKYF